MSRFDLLNEYTSIYLPHRRIAAETGRSAGRGESRRREPTAFQNAGVISGILAPNGPTFVAPELERAPGVRDAELSTSSALTHSRGSEVLKRSGGLKHAISELLMRWRMAFNRRAHRIN